jgi:hypothetical protein
MNSATGIDSQPEIALEERNMEMKNSAYNQEKQAFLPLLPHCMTRRREGSRTRAQVPGANHRSSVPPRPFIDCSHSGCARGRECETEFLVLSSARSVFVLFFEIFKVFGPSPVSMTLAASINNYIQTFFYCINLMQVSVKPANGFGRFRDRVWLVTSRRGQEYR